MNQLFKSENDPKKQLDYFISLEDDTIALEDQITEAYKHLLRFKYCSKEDKEEIKEQAEDGADDNNASVRAQEALRDDNITEALEHQANCHVADLANKYDYLTIFNMLNKKIDYIDTKLKEKENQS